MVLGPVRSITTVHLVGSNLQDLHHQPPPMPSPTAPLRLCTCTECIKHVVTPVGNIAEPQHGVYQTTQVVKAHRRRDALRRAAEVTEEQALENGILRTVLHDSAISTRDLQDPVWREHEEREREGRRAVRIAFRETLSGPSDTYRASA